jgi:hypothetical protein
VFLDPPYSEYADRYGDIYMCEDLNVSKDVQKWAVDNGQNRMLRIAFCGYDGEYIFPDDWECLAWKANGGYGGQENANRERIWFSPHCLKIEKNQMSLF